MSPCSKILLEGIDRLGKDALIEGIQNRCGYYQVLHFTKPLRLECYGDAVEASPQQKYQESSFRNMFEILCKAERARIICNRAHLGECVYAPLYRGYSGDYVLELEDYFRISEIHDLRLVLLTEDFDRSRHFRDDGLSLGGIEKRRDEQSRFLSAFERSRIRDKRAICVTDIDTGQFRPRGDILNEALA